MLAVIGEIFCGSPNYCPNPKHEYLIKIGLSQFRQSRPFELPQESFH
jgi:hypothetical protein